MKIKHQANWREQRKAAYPSIEDQLDTIYHQGVGAWKEVIQNIKDRYPKSHGE